MIQSKLPKISVPFNPSMYCLEYSSPATMPPCKKRYDLITQVPDTFKGQPATFMTWHWGRSFPKKGQILLNLHVSPVNSEPFHAETTSGGTSSIPHLTSQFSWPSSVQHFSEKTFVLPSSSSQKVARYLGWSFKTWQNLLLIQPLLGNSTKKTKKKKTLLTKQFISSRRNPQDSLQKTQARIVDLC